MKNKILGILSIISSLSFYLFTYLDFIGYEGSVDALAVLMLLGNAVLLPIIGIKLLRNRVV
jgi:hypothetical protein